MNKRSLLILVLALGGSAAQAQAPTPPASDARSPAQVRRPAGSAPSQEGPASQPSAQEAPQRPAAAEQRPSSQPASAPSTESQPASAPPASAPSTSAASAADTGSSAVPDAQASESSESSESSEQAAGIAAVPPAGTTYLPPPGSPAPDSATPPPASDQNAQQRAGLRPGEVRLASPRLYAIRPRREPRRYGDAGAPFAFGIGGGIVYRDDAGYELLSESAGSGGVELFASYDIWAPSRWVVVAGGLNFRAERHDDAEDFALLHSTLQADLSARFGVTRWLWPHVRLAAGVVATRFDVNDELAGIDYQDRDAAFAGTAGAGFTLRTPSRLFETYQGRLASLSLGVLFEGGYTLAEPAELRAEPTEARELEHATFPLGKLDRGGPYFRAAVVVRL